MTDISARNPQVENSFREKNRLSKKCDFLSVMGITFKNVPIGFWMHPMKSLIMKSQKVGKTVSLLYGILDIALFKNTPATSERA